MSARDHKDKQIADDVVGWYRTWQVTQAWRSERREEARAHQPRGRMLAVYNLNRKLRKDGWRIQDLIEDPPDADREDDAQGDE